MSRLARALRWLVLSMLLGGFLLAGALAFLLYSEAGLKWALARVAPPLGMSYAHVEGTLAGGFRLGAVRLAGAGVTMTSVGGRLEAIALLGRRVEIARLRVEGLALETEPPAAGQAPSWPFPLRLPALSAPLPVRIADLTLAGEWQGAPLRIVGNLELGVAGLRLQALEIAALGLALRAEGRVGGDPFAADLGFTLAEGPLPAALSGRVQGDLGGLMLSAELPIGGTLALALRGERLNEKDPMISLRLHGTSLDPARLHPGWARGPLDLDVSADLAETRLALRARATVGAQALALSAAGTLAADRLLLDALRLEAAPWLTLTGEGELAFDASLRFAGSLALYAPPPVAAALEGALRVSGTFADAAFDWQGRLAAPGGESALSLRGRVASHRLELSSLSLAHPAGGLTMTGVLDFAERLALDLAAQLDRLSLPHLGLPVAGVVSARMSAAAVAGAGEPRIAARIEPLSGAIAGQRLSGRAVMEWAGGEGAAEVDLALGEGRLLLRLRSEDRGLSGRLQARSLVWPPLFGALDAEGELLGSWSQPDWRLRLRLAEATVGKLRLGGVVLKAFGSGDQPGEALLRTERVAVGDVALGALAASLIGRGEDLLLAAELGGPEGRIALALAGKGVGDAWAGRIERFELARGGRALALAAPARFLVGAGGSGRLGPLCLEGDASLCLEAWRARDGLFASARLEGLPVEAFAGWLPEPWGALAGRLAAEIELAPWPSGRLALRFLPSAWPGEGPPPLAALSASASFSPESIAAEGSFEPGGSFRLSARATAAGWNGSAAAAIDLAPFAPLLPEVAGLKGRLQATWSGAFDAPEAATLRLTVEDLSAELRAFGSRLELARLALAGDLAEALIEGSGRLGAGEFTLEGRAAPLRRHVRLLLRGERLKLIDRPELALELSPEVELELASDGARLQGRVAVPRGRIDLSRFEAAEPISRDVVIAGEASAAAWPLTADLLLSVGPEVVLRGFGLDARLSGALALRERPGQPTAGFGALEAEGGFAAYGTRLDLRRGRLIFAGPLDAPVLDLRAERVIEDGPLVAVEARGAALAPEIRLTAVPPLPEEEILAYLVTGRPLARLRSGEGASLAQAAAALGTLGGDLLARRLGERLGLDLAFAQDTEGAATVTAGRQLSPRLFLGYGFALDGSGQRLILRYRLGPRWRAEVESGAELRARLQFESDRRDP